MKFLYIVILIIIIVYLLNKYENNKYHKFQNILNKEETKQLDDMVTTIIERGLVSTDCKWWDISDKLKDKSGIHTYNKLIKISNKPFIPIEMLKQKMYLVTDKKYMEEILNGSPCTFSVGKLKEKFFSTFMEKNVGVSTGCPWVKRRMVNEKTLSTDNTHPYGKIFDKYISSIVSSNKLPTNFEEFANIAQKVSTKIVFNNDEVAKPIFEFLFMANSMDQYNNTPPTPEYINKRKEYFKYMEDNIKNAKKDSLVHISKQYEKDINELSHQIPHWVFPIAASVLMTSTRLLLLLSNHKDKFQKVIDEIKKIYSPNDWNSIYKLEYLRKCILEVLRINNNVVSMFRTLTCDYKFNEEYNFKKGTQFAILTNPVLRNKKYFKEPDKFIPERWNNNLEHNYIPSISFSRGMQKCPGKDLALFITSSFMIHYLKKSGVLDSSVNKIQTKIINTDNIDHAINPCTITVGEI